MIGHLAAKNKTSFSEFKKSVIYGNVMGSFAVEKYGLAGLTSLKKSDISKRIRQYEKMITFLRVIDKIFFYKLWKIGWIQFFLCKKVCQR